MKKMPVVVSLIVVVVVVVVRKITTIFGEIVMMVVANPGCYQCDGCRNRLQFCMCKRFRKPTNLEELES